MATSTIFLSKYAPRNEKKIHPGHTLPSRQLLVSMRYTTVLKVLFCVALVTPFVSNLQPVQADIVLMASSQAYFLLNTFKSSLPSSGSIYSTWSSSFYCSVDYVSTGFSWQGVACDSDGYVTEIDLQDEGLSGGIPSTIGTSLFYLTSLKLLDNSISGSIPSSLGSATYLSYIDLSNNRLTGSIPLTFTDSTLVYLYLENNYLTGTVPYSSATTFDTYGNCLSGTSAGIQKSALECSSAPSSGGKKGKDFPVYAIVIIVLVIVVVLVVAGVLTYFYLSRRAQARAALLDVGITQPVPFPPKGDQQNGLQMKQSAV